MTVKLKSNIYVGPVNMLYMFTLHTCKGDLSQLQVAFSQKRSHSQTPVLYSITGFIWILSMWTSMTLFDVTLPLWSPCTLINFITSAEWRRLCFHLCCVLSVSLSFSKITDKRFSGFSWYFQNMADMTPGKFWNIQGIFRLTSWTQDFFFYVFGAIRVC